MTIKLSDIVLDENIGEDHNYHYGYISKALTVFGDERFATGDERLGLSIAKSIDLPAVLPKLNDYLEWLSDCKETLISFYKEEFTDEIETYYDGEMASDWFETLEVYSGSICVSEDGDFSADFSTGDNMDEDHLLIIEIEGYDVSSMWHDG